MIDRLAKVSGREVPRETFEKLEMYAALLRDEAQHQNLVSAATLESLWERHIADSAQLVRFAPNATSSWADIGSGAGLPGVVISLLVSGLVTLIEPRRLRADFLNKVVSELGLGDRVTVTQSKAESVRGQFDVITARAVAGLDALLRISTHLSTRNTVWVLPKGRNAQSELAEARRHWHCDVEVVPSSTDEQSQILVLRNVKARGGR